MPCNIITGEMYRPLVQPHNLWKLYFILIAQIALDISKCEADENAITTPSTFEHRGAARQMYGSGSLRPPGPNPMVQRMASQKGKVVEGQQKTNRRRKGGAMSYQPIPVVPVSIPLHDFDSIPDGYPVFMPESMIPSSRSAGIKPYNTRGGFYGGRPEYYKGRPPISRFPVDEGFVPGRGFEVQGANPGYGKIQYGKPSRRHGAGLSSVKASIEDMSVNGNEEYDQPCGEDCGKNEFLCTRSCTCIENRFRCDGDQDCEGDEDEQDCGELNIGGRVIKCEESPKHIRCPKTGKCISKGWLCDGDDDCGDFSDETHCGPVIENCTADEFECDNSLCIPKTWLCDNDNDCKDNSDEINCTKHGCTEDEFTCNDGSCISVTWKCDKESDCPDASDEANCDIEPPSCGEGEFQCAVEKCIKIEFRCDDDDDCGDWSDEQDCSKLSGNCITGEFRCNSGKCIPERWRCDKQQDCEDNEDEKNCNLNNTRTCSPEEFTCNNGVCILNSWICDGIADCNHGEDEEKCKVECDNTKFACLGAGANDTNIAFCINKKRVCDGHKDCPKGEDENNCPKNKRACDKSSNCTQLCLDMPDGKINCGCRTGYQLKPDGVSCEDMDECLYETDPVCSQTCNNTIGSYICGCMTGYTLRPDMRTCKALGAPPTLLFANRLDIRQVSLSSTKYTSILKGLHNAIALDYHHEKGLIFWSDVSMDVIRKAYINGTGITDIIKWGLESPGGVALDWIHNILFWTDSGTRRIEVANLNGRQRAIIAANDLDKPRAITVHPGEALIFWSDWGPNPKIEKAEMDGSNRKVVISESIFWPNGITLDYTTNRLYWADAKHNVIESALFDGSDRKKIISKGLPHPFALTLFEDAIYWTDWHSKCISTANKNTGAGLRTVHSNLHFPMDIHSYHPQRQPNYRNHCGSNNGGCQHMCLPNKKSYSCVCQMGQKLKSDGKSCQQPEKLLIFARKKDIRIKHLDSNAAHQHEMVIPVDGVKSAMAIAWDAKNDTIFWSDVEKDTINVAHWNGSDQKVIIQSNLESPAGLALDWITNKLYWTDTSTSRIEVATTDGLLRNVLVWDNLDKPRDIIVDPIGGYMYWSDWGEKPKIEKAAMDGDMRITLISQNLTWPNSLAIDYAAGRLYWADGGTKAIEHANLDGSNRKLLLGGPDLPHPFGLDVFGNYVYWTDWTTSNIESANKVTGSNRTILAKTLPGLMDVRIFHRNRRTIKTSCSDNNGGCSHLCLLKPKGHTCACPTGIKLLADGKNCADNPTNFLILAHRTDIRQISLDVPYAIDVVMPFSSLKNVMSLDVDRKTGEIYWTDIALDVIQKGSSDGKMIKTVIKFELQMADGIAIDSTGRKIYWTDGERNSIEVAELDGHNRKLLIWKDLDAPRAITLHYHHGVMFWSDWGTHARIEKAHMDGANRITLINENVAWPNGLAIDRPANRLYWNDGKLKTIESCDLNGKDRQLIVNDVPHPYGLVVVGSHIYWTDWQTESLHRADKLNGSDRRVIRNKLPGLMDVRSVQSDNIAENACGTNNGGCSHLCLRNPQGFTCACPTGLNISKENSKECGITPSMYILFSSRMALVRISLETPELWDVTLPIPKISHAVDVDFHWEKKLYYYSDVEKNEIKSVNMKNMSDVKLVISNISSPNGIAIDWVANNLYWTSTKNKVVEVASYNGTNRKVIIKDDLLEPRSITVYPKKGYLYWSDWGEKPKIERSFMDGSSRKAIINANLGFPNGLVIDYGAKRLYWTDARWDRIETSDLNGQSRIQLVHNEPNLPLTHPFALTQFGEYIYWSDWFQKAIIRADKATGKSAAIVRTHLDGAMGITTVTPDRQQGWNPCAENNGGCTHLCFFKLENYTCGCPDAPTAAPCYTEPSSWVPIKLQGKDYDDDDSQYIDLENNLNDMVPEMPHTGFSHHKILLCVLSLIIIGVVLVAGALFYMATVYRKQKNKYLYSTGRSVMTYANPNYYTPGADSGSQVVPPATDKKPFIWKRLKYDKSQERVYEETVGGSSSPEVTSLIPAILTPSSSQCETITPDMQHSPTNTPLKI